MPNYDTLICTSDGRLFLSVRGAASANMLLVRQSSAQATRKESRGTIEGHGIEFVGEIPGDWGHLDYPNIGFVGDRVVVSWNSTVSGPRLLVAPASWFYQDDKPYQPPADAPKLLINGTELPGTWIEDRFLVNLTDVAEALGRQVKRNMLATLHQALTALTALAVEPVYDRSAVGHQGNGQVATGRPVIDMFSSPQLWGTTGGGIRRGTVFYGKSPPFFIMMVQNRVQCRTICFGSSKPGPS